MHSAYIKCKVPEFSTASRHASKMWDHYQRHVAGSWTLDLWPVETIGTSAILGCILLHCQEEVHVDNSMVNMPPAGGPMLTAEPACEMTTRCEVKGTGHLRPEHEVIAR